MEKCFFGLTFDKSYCAQQNSMAKHVQIRAQVGRRVRDRVQSITAVQILVRVSQNSVLSEITFTVLFNVVVNRATF